MASTPKENPIPSLLKFVSSALITVNLLFFCAPWPATATEPLDSDSDGIRDMDEIKIYSTDPFDKDTDGDGYSDFVELNRGFSPHSKTPLKLESTDTDKDGLSDRDELRFGCALTAKDSDRDGFSDGDEIGGGFDPMAPGKIKLPKSIKVNLKLQIMETFLGQVRIGSYRISSGRASMPTPKGIYSVSNKSAKAWSRTYGLWMPYWIGIKGTRIGIHELPIWPGGYREGASHLGLPVSHGCIRLGIGDARKVYDWTDFDTKVIIN